MQRIQSQYVRNVGRIAFTLCVILAIGCLTSVSFGQTRDKSVLIINWNIGQKVDPTLKEMFNAWGYNVATSEYGEVTNEKLTKYNLIILDHEPNQSFGVSQSEIENYKKLCPIFLEYLKKGGGLFVMHSPAYNNNIQDVDMINTELLAPLGAKISYEGIMEVEDKRVIDGPYKMVYSATKNITRHPVTEGVSELWYPQGLAYMTRMTSPIEVSGEWEVVAKGSQTSYTTVYDYTGLHDGSPKYAGNAPLVAVRSYGKGRIVLFSTSSIYWIHDAYHPLIDGFLYKNGDGETFIKNALNWLSEPSFSSDIYGGGEDEPVPPAHIPWTENIKELWGSSSPMDTTYFDFPSFETGIRMGEIDPNRVKKGIIGIMTNVTDGRDAVEDFCREAKKMKLDFLIFAENHATLTEEKWKELVTRCEKQSDDSFIAIPGVRFQNTSENDFIAWNIPGWINHEEIQGNYFGPAALLLRYIPKYPSIAIVNPSSNPYEPYALRFFNTFAVFNYQGRKPSDNALETHKKMVIEGRWATPVVYHDIRDIQTLKGMRGGFLTYIPTGNIAEIAAKAGGYDKSTFVSNGPVIEDFRLVGVRSFSQGDLRYFSMRTYSDARLQDVTLYKDGKVFRRFYPTSNSFEVIVAEVLSGTGVYFLEVRDERGHLALSSDIHTMPSNKYFEYCMDNQNTIESIRCGDSWIKGGIYMNNEEGGAPLITIPEAELTPEGYEFGVYGLRYLGTNPRFYTTEGPVTRNPNRKLSFGTDIVSIIDNDYNLLMTSVPGMITGMKVDTRDFESRVRYTLFTPRPYSYQMLLVSIDTTVNRDLTLETRDGLEFLLFNPFSERLDDYPNYVYLAGDGQKRKGARNVPNVVVASDKLARNGYIGLYPSYWGSPAIFPILPKDYDISVNAYSGGYADIAIGHDWPNKQISAGTNFKDEFLYVLDTGKFSDESAFDEVYDKYGFDGTPAYFVTMMHGARKECLYPVRINAKDYCMEFATTEAELPNDLPFIVSGVCDNWDACMYDLDSKKMKRIGVYQNEAYASVDTTSPRHIFIGNILTCNDEDVILEYIDIPGGAKIIAHNPQNKSVSITITSQPLLANVLKFSQKMELSAGETKVIEIKGGL